MNNASVQHMATSLEHITPDQLQETFAINVFGYFYMAQVGAVMRCTAHNDRLELQALCASCRALWGVVTTS